MKQDFYITQDGILKREENTVYFENEYTKRALPINRINAIYSYGSNSLTSGVILYLAKKGIPVHFFDYYGWYKGTLYPRETLVSGDMIIKQAEHYLDQKKRLYIAGEMVEGAIRNTLRNLSYYSRNQPSVTKHQERASTYLEKLENAGTIAELMQIEGQVKHTYYKALDLLFPKKYKILRRTRRPPENRTNTLISFGNSLLYATCLSEIYNTQLNPTISFLHEPSERRFSLSLDISEIFKPIIVDRIIMKLINKNMLEDNCFEGNIGDMLLSPKGKRLFLKEYDNRLSTTIIHRTLGRRVSYQRLIRLELYKLCKHCLGDKKYKPFVLWW